MTASLAPLTQVPALDRSLPFFPNEDRFGMSSLFRRIVVWQADTTSCFKLSFAFFMEKVFAFLDRCGIGSCFYTKGFTGRIKVYEDALSAHRRERGEILVRGYLQRQKIVNALGGEELCKHYSVVNLNPQDRAQYLKLNDQYISSGHDAVQGEDEGRKFVALRLHDSSNQLLIATVHQLYQETDDNGGLWVANFQPSRPQIVGTENVANFIKNEISWPGSESSLPFSYVRKP
jgi:hypothetical protein